MADKTYYYLKLKDNFFESDELKILESMENGYLYSNILLKMYLKSLKGNGKLMFNDYIPYDAKMLSTITGHNIDIVEKALKIFKQMCLIDIFDNGTIYMLDIQKMLGSISSEGIRKAEYRERIKLEKNNGTSLGQCPNIISISNSNSNSISNINNKKEINKERKKITNYDGIISEIQNEELKQTLYEFIKMRQMIKKPLTDRALQMIINKLRTLSNGNCTKAIKILNQSIINSWQDVYKLKDDAEEIKTNNPFLKMLIEEGEKGNE